MGKNNVRLQMKLVHSNFASLLLFLLRFILMDSLSSPRTGGKQLSVSSMV
ncbi:unnamed protein product, partial [Brassica rapa]